MPKVLYEIINSNGIKKGTIKLNGKLLLWSAINSNVSAKNNAWPVIKFLFNKGLTFNYSKLLLREKSYILRMLYLIVVSKEFNCDYMFSYKATSFNNVYTGFSLLHNDAHSTTIHINRNFKQIKHIKLMRKNGVANHNNYFYSTYSKPSSVFKITLDDPVTESINHFDKNELIKVSSEAIRNHFYKNNQIIEYMFNEKKYDVVVLSHFVVGIEKKHNPGSQYFYEDDSTIIKNGIIVIELDIKLPINIFGES